MSGLLDQFKTMNAYEVHKALINTYVLQRPGDTSLLKRDTSKDKRDIDVLRENHKFLWDDGNPETWEEQLAKRYYDKLFKEYCICDLKFYKENKVALRWRIEQEVITGKGQFTCGEKNCKIDEELRTWEVNFGYYEQNEKKNALVKLRLCPLCSKKLNYRTKKREVKRLSKKSKKPKQLKIEETKHEEPSSTSEENLKEDKHTLKEDTPWSGPQEVNEKTREEEIEDYLADLLF